jgi:hypothetical protein
MAMYDSWPFRTDYFNREYTAEGQKQIVLIGNALQRARNRQMAIKGR